MTAMKQFTITIPIEYDNRTAFEQVLSDINAMTTEGQIGDEGTWSGIILEDECDCDSCNLVDIVTSVIDNTCIGCSQFYVDVRESACICDLLMDAPELDIIGYADDDAGSNDFCAEWERQQRETLNDLTPEDREKIANDLPCIPYGDDDEDDEE